MGNKFKILSIDGGGIRGVIPCKVLAKMEHDLMKKEGKDVRLCDYFDLICGTSTGSILAIGLALGMTAERLLEFYEDYGNEIFPPDRRSWPKKFSNWMLGQSFYERRVLRKSLLEAYGQCVSDGDARLGDARTALVVPAYNGEMGEMYVFKTPLSEDEPRDGQVPAMAVALSSSAAPMYFRPYSFAYSKKGTREKCVFKHMVDGSVVANNPAFIGLAEAVRNMKIPLKDISLLSIGTGSVGYTISMNNSSLTPHFWSDPISSESMRLFNALAAVQSRDVHEKLYLLQNGLEEGEEKKFEYLRLQHTFQNKDFIELDDASKEAILEMNLIAHQLYDDHAEQIQKMFFSEKRDIRTTDNTAKQ